MQLPFDGFQLQMSADVMDLVSWLSGLEVAVDKKGTKSAYSLAQCDPDGGLVARHGDSYDIHLPRGEPVPVPRIPGSYRHVGTDCDVLVGNTETTVRVVHRCAMAIRLLSRVGSLERKALDIYCNTAVCGVITYYGRTTPLS